MPFWENQIYVTLIWLDARNKQRDVTSKWCIPKSRDQTQQCEMMLRYKTHLQSRRGIYQWIPMMMFMANLYTKIVVIFIYTPTVWFSQLSSLWSIYAIYGRSKTNGAWELRCPPTSGASEIQKKSIQNPPPLNSQKGWRFFSYNPAT